MMKTQQPCLGCGAVPKRGRDAGRPMLVVGIVDENYVLICDGDLRRIDNPKKKKLKHLVLKDVVHEETAERLNEGKSLLNADIRHAICDVFGCKDGQKE